MQKKVVILGGGVCGLYAALTSVRSGYETHLLEKKSIFGGLAAGERVGENFCDYGVHMLHAFDQEIFEDVASVMGEEKITVALDARIQWGGRSFRYPLKFIDMLETMPAVTLGRCVLGLLVAEGTRMLRPPDDQTAEDALITYYGAPLYEYFFEKFTHRYWGIHPQELSAEFVKRKMPRLSAVDTLRRLFRRKKADALVESAIEEETLHYSETGAETLPRKLAEKISLEGGILQTDVELQSLRIEQGQVKGVEYTVNGDEGVIQPDEVISTIPLPSLVELYPAKESVVKAATSLSYKPITVFAVLVDKERCMEGLYTYYRDRLFHRVGEPKNAGMKVKPNRASLLICEMTCEVGDAKWEGDVIPQLLDDLEEEGLCCRADVIQIDQLHYEHAYPIYNLNFEKSLRLVQQDLLQIKNLQSIGRQGAFLYPGMHTSMRMGKNAVEEIAKNRDHRANQLA